ncbi:SH3 domain-containing protein [Paraclostridium sordellii]|uniref:SH3 domain-containing protein n=1 Tax=Paraclostridium sordellii TaxID=1505 RepID=UPI0005E2B63E|nr:SH3 domain-containing protein [Paeniclostridium sordellii]CEN78998.1 surface protein [[Clostridium] sordellii] [Paeniclostridium sordellii]
MSKRSDKFTKYIAAFGIISATTVANVVPVGASPKDEAEFSTVMDKYNAEDIVVENGASLRKGEALDLPDNQNLETLDNETVSIENGVVKPTGYGTVHLSQEINGKAHVTELYVPSETRRYNFASTPKSNRNYYKVFIDPGHGGQDSGAVGNGKHEDELNLAIARKVEQKLKSKGIEVKMSRYNDEFISLSDRAKMANQYAPDVFISIHHNSSDLMSANGIETYYHTRKGEYSNYAQNIQNSAINETGARNRGIKSANFAVLRETNMPSALVESGFITNPTESANLTNSNYKEKLANGIVNGIEIYLKDNIKIDEPGTGIINNYYNDQNYFNTGKITADRLNIRSGYGTNYLVIGTLTNGSKVEIVGSQNGWYKIKYNGGYGYISGDYVKIDGQSKPDIKPEELVVKNTGVVNAAILNVRNGYGVNYQKIGILTNGSKVEIVGSQNGWYKIKYNGGYGYISIDYVKVDGESKIDIKPEELVVKNTGVVNATTLNVRNGCGANYQKIGTLINGSKVEIVESQNGWYKIKYNGGYGYISGDYVKIDGENKSDIKPEEPVVKNTGVVNATTLNVRNGCGVNYQKIGILINGSKIEIVESQNGWYKIKYNGGYGYISGDYVKIDGKNKSDIKPEDPVVKNTGVVNATTLNVRNGCGANHQKIGTLINGSKVEIVESQNGWYKIKYNGGYGYISGDYVKIDGKNKSDIKPEEPVVKNTGVVNATTLNVRNGCGANHQKMGTLTNGSKVEIVESQNGWYKIKYNGGYGYITGDYVKIDGEQQSDSKAQEPNVMSIGTITADRLNVRSGYGTNHFVTGTLTNGSKVEIVESQNGWHKIKYNGTYGYIYGQFVNKSDNKVSSNTKVGTVNATILNVRNGYGINNKKIGILTNGSKVEIVESQNGWYKIKYNGNYGYISGDFIKIG